jgi:dienelactone hydrolase
VTGSPPAIDTTDEEVGGLLRREFTLSRDNRDVTGVLWLPAEPRPDSAIVCLGHGASGDRHQTPIPWLAKKFVGEHSMFALSIDGPVHGRRQSGPGGRESFWPEWRREGSVEDMTADWQLALDWAQGEEAIGKGPVGYWGLSMGTIYGAPFVAADSRVEVAVLGLMGLTGPDHYVPRIREAAETIRVPVLFIIQLEDELFDRQECFALFDAFASTNKRLHASPGLHPEVPIEELHHSVDFLVKGLEEGHKKDSSAFSISE